MEHKNKIGYLLDDTTVEGTIISPSCHFCIHRLGIRKCKAYDIIPDIIWDGDIEHTNIFAGQKGDYVYTEETKK